MNCRFNLIFWTVGTFYPNIYQYMGRAIQRCLDKQWKSTLDVNSHSLFHSAVEAILIDTYSIAVWLVGETRSLSGCKLRKFNEMYPSQSKSLPMHIKALYKTISLINVTNRLQSDQENTMGKAVWFYLISCCLI